MNRPDVIRQQLVLWAFVLGLWALLILAFSGQLVLTTALEWPQAIRVSLRDWLPWILLAPAVAWLAGRFPLERQKLWLSVPIHIVACMLAVFCCYLIWQALPPARGPLPGGPQLRFRDGRGEGPPPDRPFRGGQPPLREGAPRQTPERRQEMFLTSLMVRAGSGIPVYWVIVSIAHALAFYRRSQERERKALELQASLTDARLQALRMQLHPHFLFNTLNAIATLVHKDPRAADEMIANLSELLRAALETSEQEIPLRRELDFLNRYLEIQQVRFGDRLRIEKEIDAAALVTLVPTLLLQPLAENAVRHGIEPHAVDGLVQIRARRENDVLHLTIRDSGSGPKKSPGGDQHGVGLSNTRSRLRELYGQRARLTFSSASHGGFSVDIEIPFHEAPLSTRPEPEPAI